MTRSRAETIFSKFCAIVERERRRLKVPGLAVGIWHEGKEFTRGFGVTSLEHPIAVTADTLFQAGSITKTFTATILMHLADGGRLSLDAPVRRYLPSFRLRDERVARRVTARHLLTHSGGWVGDYFNDFGNGDDALAKMVDEIARLPQIHPLGTIYSYNNAGFNIAARLIECLTRISYEHAVEEIVLDPLRLRMTYFFPSDVLITHRFALGHIQQNGRVNTARPWAIGRAGNGVGGIVSSVRDLLAYARFHLGRGPRVVSQKALQAMRVPQMETDDGEVGLSWFIKKAGRLTYFIHRGATNGQKAMLMMIPDEKFALTILGNSDDAGTLLDAALPAALRIYFGVQSAPPRTFKKSARELREYAGEYRIGTEACRLTAKDGQLIYHHIPLGGFPTPSAPPGPAQAPVRLRFYAADCVLGLNEPMLNEHASFIRGRNGRIQYFRIGGRAQKRLA